MAQPFNTCQLKPEKKRIWNLGNSRQTHLKGSGMFPFSHEDPTTYGITSYKLLAQVMRFLNTIYQAGTGKWAHLEIYAAIRKHRGHISGIANFPDMIDLDWLHTFFLSNTLQPKQRYEFIFDWAKFDETTGIPLSEMLEQKDDTGMYKYELMMRVLCMEDDHIIRFGVDFANRPLIYQKSSQMPMEGEMIFWLTNQNNEEIEIGMDQVNCGCSQVFRRLLPSLKFVEQSVKKSIKIQFALDGSYPYMFTLQLVRRVPADELKWRFTHAISWRSNSAVAIFNHLHEQGLDSSYMDISLNCPITATPIRRPMHSLLCRHTQVFDGTNFLNHNLSSAGRREWRCPICERPLMWLNICYDSKILLMLSRTPLYSERLRIYRNGYSTFLFNTSDGISYNPQLSFGQDNRSSAADLLSECLSDTCAFTLSDDDDDDDDDEDEDENEEQNTDNVGDNLNTNNEGANTDTGNEGANLDTGNEEVNPNTSVKGNKPDTGNEEDNPNTGNEEANSNTGVEGNKPDTGKVGDKPYTGKVGDKPDTGKEGDNPNTGTEGVKQSTADVDDEAALPAKRIKRKD